MADSVILPPPSAKNPLPALPAALRIDNRERLLEVLLTNPTLPPTELLDVHGDAAAAAALSFRQLLVFGKDNLRTLLLRQVLQDPTNPNTKKAGKTNPKTNKNKNWDDAKSFPLPKVLKSNVTGTRVLLQRQEDSSNPLEAPRNRTHWKGVGHDLESIKAGDDPDFFKSPHDLFDHADVITYFIRPWDLDQTMAVIARIQNSKLEKASSSGRTHKQHHRIVYVPRVTATCAKVLADHRVWDPHHQTRLEQQRHQQLAGGNLLAGTTNSVYSSCVSVTGLPIELFPLGSDVLSLEYDESLREAGAVGGTPSPLIETTSRALQTLQDVLGPIPRIQSMGIWGEEVLDKLLNQTVDDYWAAQRDGTGGANDGAAADPWDDEDDETGESKQAPLEDLGTSNHSTAMVLLDRRLDMVTPMVTPLTYEGLLDELVGIECGHLEIPEAVLNPPEDGDDDDTTKEESKESSTNPFDSPAKTRNPFDDNTDGTSASKPKPKLASLGVHEGDTLFAAVRDQHVEQFGSFLQNQAVALKESHANFTSKETKKDLDEIEKFVKQIPIFTQSLRSLTNHIHLAELIKATTEDVAFRDQWSTERAMIEGEYCYDFLEDCIYEQDNPYKVLRLICLQSLASGGIRANRYDQIRQAIVQVYGYEFLPVLHDLETMGWIKKMEGNLATNFVTGDTSRSLFQNLKRNLLLIHAEVNAVEPDDVSYVSSGYAPLTVRLIQSAMQGWASSPDKEDALRDLFQMMVASNNCGGSNANCRLLDVRQFDPPVDLPTTLRRQQQRKEPQQTAGSSLGAFGRAHREAFSTKPTLIVVYLGGITYMELAALRFLSKKETFAYHIVVVTTKIINGSKLLQQMGQ